MPWHPDVPELNIPKPKAIKWLEELGDDVLHAMDTVEINRRIDDAAGQIAQEYAKKPGADYEGCVDLISMALSVTGNAMGGRVGALFVGRCDEAAEKAARLVYPDPFMGDL